MASRRDLPDHAPEVRRALADPHHVAELLGLERSRTEKGKWTCPRHGGTSLSLTLGKDRTLRVKCFGCELAGDVFSLVAEVRGLDAKKDFRSVLREAAQLAGLWGVVAELEGGRQIGHSGPPKKGPVSGHSAPPKKKPEPEPAIAPLDVDAFDAIACALLERCPLGDDARSYLDARRMTDLAEAAGWGEIPGSPQGQGRLVAELVDMFGAETMQRSGLLVREGEAKLVWRGHRLVIPWRVPGICGVIHSLQRRLLRAPSSPKEPKYVFPSGVGRPVWPFLVVEDLEELGADTAIAFVEGAPDVLALRWIARNEGRDVLVLGVPGVENWRADWARFATGRAVLVALDADKAGEKKATEMHADLHTATSWKRWRPKSGKDWADVLAEVRT